MAGADEILATVEAIYAAGLDTDLWPQALAAVTRTVGGIAATLEIYNRSTLGLDEFHIFGMPPAHENAYLADFMKINPRYPAVLKLKPGSLIWDDMVLDEDAMNRDAFYSDFLAPAGLRYFIGGKSAKQRPIAVLCHDSAHGEARARRSTCHRARAAFAATPTKGCGRGAAP